MSHDEIVTRLAKTTENASEIIYSITTRSVLAVIVQRMGEEALNLSAKDLNLALEEVKEAICHNLDERDFINIGLDVWEITRNL